MGQFLQTIKKRFLKLKDDLHSGIKNGALDIAGAGIINRILMFLTTVVITRVLSKQDYGVYSYSFNFISFVALFCSLGMNAVMLQYASEQKDENKRDYIYKFTFELGLISCFLFSVLVVVYSLVFKEKISGINHTIRQFSFILIFALLFPCLIKSDNRPTSVTFFLLFSSLLIS